MTENDVARHMGHELEAYRKFYRLQDDVIELIKAAASGGNITKTCLFKYTETFTTNKN